MNLSPNARCVLEKRYLKKDSSGRPSETPEALFHRVARDIASAETVFGGDARRREREFFEMMAEGEFLPNSPTLMNAGRDLQQLAACFVLPVEDSIDSIFGSLRAAALIHKSGGGTGFSFSRLRPRGDGVASSQGAASGPVSFIRVFNAATNAINQGGFRRGANMAVLSVDHPDIEEFVACKRDRSELTNFNISVLVTDAFMQKAAAGEPFALVNPRTRQVVRHVDAARLLDTIVKQAHETGEPGLLFKDRIERDNPTPSLGAIEATNPCGEQPLLPFEACTLASIDLARFTAAGMFDLPRLERTIAAGVRFLDDVLERNRYPLPQIERLTRANRKIGLGVMGWAEALVRLGIPYDSEEAVALADRTMSFFSRAARAASQELARERGPFANYPESVHARGAGYPMRHATVTTVAPTGTLSILAGTSGGIEPLFAIAFRRQVLDGEILEETHAGFRSLAREGGFDRPEVWEHIAKTGSARGCPVVPERVRRIFATAADIAPDRHVRMQAAFQRHVDSAVSKTINFPAEATVPQVAEAFLAAWRQGCKGITVYRDRSRAGQAMARSSDCSGPACLSA
ncbi:MAG: adenosylcobalamin-dependent ribonucleoside-diphosphate reductase [Planctomycetes bacterium]|nr:adenosylcobalamin-dependent ribonucleoside-diphosphate reductase [Planctomycetota bacterium]